MDPFNGKVKALVGGYSFVSSEFNRATQAKRQPGSAFKPIVYSAALENGFSPNSKILDAPFVIDQGSDLGKWSPSNYTNKFYKDCFTEFLNSEEKANQLLKFMKSKRKVKNKIIIKRDFILN